MKYTLQVFMGGAMAEFEKLPADEQSSIRDEYLGVLGSPGVIEGNQLQPAATATTVRVRGGDTITTAGPFSGTKEPLGGYYLLEADDLGIAIELAARIPAARMGGAIEIRPIFERQTRSE